eukprot:gb/GECG01006395.1/.p1 GENE.gb/GECG01006395.1/~~gb/GECG01006395.1/.p1  ORF type:complete len:1147 (+),score=102.26 gb/GECG01006395.1/:1-3441(+)
MEVEQPATTLYRRPEQRKGVRELMGLSHDGSAAAEAKDDEDTSSPDQAKQTQKGEAKDEKLGWVKGVFIPVTLNILGVIMFLRLSWVGGQAGLIGGTVIILLSNFVTVITTLSLSAIVSNGEVQGGGAYYLISRSLGPAFGGSIGILFFLGQSMATSLYVIGFAESVVELYTSEGAELITGSIIDDQRIVGFVAATAVLLVSLIGIGWYAKTQTALLAILLVSVGSVYVGAFFPAIPDETENETEGFVGFQDNDIPWTSKYTTDLTTNVQYDFLSVFSVFFPAVTGIMAGANISGDLKNPSTAIPKGTLSAVGLTSIVYLLILWFLALTCLRCVGEACSDITVGGQVLAYGSKAWADAISSGRVAEPEGGLAFSPLIMANVSLWRPLVYIGVYAATLSSALASLVGAPRILQAVAIDKLYPSAAIYYFSQYGPGLNPENIANVLRCNWKASHSNKGNSSTSDSQFSRPPLASDKIAYPHTYVHGKHVQAQHEDVEGTTQKSVTVSGAVPSPVRGYFLTYIITLACISAGDLNRVAPLISNFFMLCYALTNFACFRASMSAMPGWRPSFRFYNRYLSLVGAIVCIVLIFALEWITALVSVALGGVLYKYIEWTDPAINWGPASDAARYLTAISALYKLRKIKTDATGRGHVKTFRPSYLVMTKDPRSVTGKCLITFVSKLYKGRGVSLIAQVLEAPIQDLRKPEGMSSLESTSCSLALRQRLRNQRFLDRAAQNSTDSVRSEKEDVNNTSTFTSPNSVPIEFEGEENEDDENPTFHTQNKRSPNFRGSNGLDALRLTEKQRSLLIAETVTAPQPVEGLANFLQLGGIGPLRPNTVVLGFPEAWMFGKSQTSGTAEAQDGKAEVVKRVSEYESMQWNSFTAGLAIMTLRDTNFQLLDGILPSERRRMCSCMNHRETVDNVNEGTKVPTIDVWWLEDEGGLAVLIPYLLNQNPQYRDHKIRVFTVGAPDSSSNDATVDARHRSVKLGNLLTKLRIKADYVSYKSALDSISGYSIQLFEALYPGILQDKSQSEEQRSETKDANHLNESLAKNCYETVMNSGGVVNLEPELGHLDKSMKNRLDLETRRVIRAGELMRQESAEASIVFAVLPYPRRYQPVGLLTAWSEILSLNLPPTVLLRGNGDPVVTLDA